MSLLLEIQASASDSSVPIQDLLRKCLILADRLGYEPLKEWARQELEGYPKDGDLPPYRVLAVADVQYDAVVGFYRLSGQSVARGVVPESRREEFFTARLHSPAAALQQMAESEGKLGAPVDPMAANYLVREMYEEPEASSLGMTRIITRSQVMAVIDMIRTRVLEFALEINRLDPSAGEAEGPAPLSHEAIRNVYNTTIQSGENIAIGSPGVQQLALTVTKGDWDSLDKLLRNIGLEEDPISELRQALDEDEPIRSPNEMGERTRKWLGWVTEQATRGAIQLASMESIKFIAQAIMLYLTGEPGSGGDGGFTIADIPR